MPHLTKNYYLNFYGGEPLLSFELIKKALSFLQIKNKEFKKKANYSITTNGSLLTKEIIQFLNEHKFSVGLSFDGLVQDVQKEKGSFKKVASFIEELLNHPNIKLEVNSVFTPRTIKHLTESIKFIISLNASNIHFAFSVIERWDNASLLTLKKEMAKMGKFLLSHYSKKGNVPVTNFREEERKGIFYCAAGKDRLALTPEGEIWGCFLFPDYFKGKENSPEYQKFFFGTLEHFIENHKNIYRQISQNYCELSMENFSTPKMRCVLCSDLENCVVCPVNAAFSSLSMGKIPSFLCEIQKIQIMVGEEFREALELLNRDQKRLPLDNPKKRS